MEAKFCHECGRALAARYPGCYDKDNPPDWVKEQLRLPPDERTHEAHEMHPQGNPENGPKSLRCPAGHTPIEEVIEDAVHAVAPAAYREILQEIQQGGSDPHMQPSRTVKLAAGLLLAWDEHLDLHYAALFAEEQDRLDDEENAANMPDLGPDYDGR